MLQRTVPSPSHRTAALLVEGRRLFWLVMLLLHLPAIRSAWGVLADGAVADWAMGGLRLTVLLASAAFFALKIADVAYLRLNSGWRPLIASVVIIGLLHVNVLRRTVESDSPYSTAPIAALAVVGTIVESATLRRSLLRVVRIALGNTNTVNPCAARRFVAVNTEETPSPLLTLLASGLLLPRPPPTR